MICKGRHGCMEGSQALPGTKHLPSLNIWVMLSPPNWVQPPWLVRIARPSRLGEYWPQEFYKQKIGSRGLALNIVEEQKTCGFLAHSLQLIKEQWWGQKSDENIWIKFLLTFKNGLQHHTTEILLFVSYSWIWQGKKIGLHRFWCEAAQQQIPPVAVSVADKVEFNIFQTWTGQRSCFLLPQHLKFYCQNLHVL